MKLLRGVAMLFVVLSYGSAFGTQDPVWMFADTSNTVHVYYNNFICYDTARIRDLFRFFPIDTGASYDGSPYINFDYQFTNDSIIYRDPYDTNTILYRDLRPGYAGFKTAWDGGVTGFFLRRYKYLIMAYKGPLPAHKVTIKFWYNGGNCGDPSFFEIIGSFAASSTWKVDTIPIPESIQNKPDNARNNSKYYEMVVLINNADPNDTNKSSPRGCLKIDNIRLAGCNPIDTSPVPQNVTEGEAVTFRVATTRADSADVLTYQWKKDGVDIPAGADSSVYTLNSVKAADTGAYTVAVTVSSTSLTFTSLPAMLTLPAPEKKKCGCGSGTGLALIPPLFFKAMAVRRRKKNVRHV
jgi:hypothetical protein